MNVTRLLLRLSLPTLAIFVAFVGALNAVALTSSPQLAFVTINQREYTLNLADTHHRLEVPVVSYSVRISSPVWSPDGHRVAFRLYNNNGHQLTIYDVETREEVLRLRDGTTLLSMPAWSPDGKKLAFVSDAMAGVFHLYVVDFNAGEVQQLTNQPINDFTPVWSHDGESLTYAAWRDNRIVAAQVDVDTPEDAGESILLPEFASMYGATWSPDRMQIAFSSSGSNAVRSSSIFVMDVDGSTAVSESRTITNSAESNIVPLWSPDGERIAFVSDRDGENDLYMVATEQDNPQRLTYLDTELVHPDWSPDGSSIAFIARENRGWSVMVLNVNSANVYPLTHDRVPIGIAWRP